jgi:proline iminopeptidase
MQVETMLIESINAKLYVDYHQNRGAEMIILLHGGPGVPMDFSSLINKLSRKYQIIAFDQRGTGRSPAKGAAYSIDEYLIDIDVIAKHFQINRFHLFGHSWGGLYAQIYAEKYPQKVLSLFLSSPSSGTGEIWKQTENEIMKFNKNHSSFCEWYKMGMYSLLGTLGSNLAYQSLFKQVLENYNKDFDPTFIANDMMVENVRAKPVNKTRKSIAKYPLLGDFDDYRFPTMIVYGEKDIYGASKQFVKKRFPNATFAEIKNAGHIPWEHNKKRFFEILCNFYKINH